MRQQIQTHNRSRDLDGTAIMFKSFATNVRQKNYEATDSDTHHNYGKGMAQPLTFKPLATAVRQQNFRCTTDLGRKDLGGHSQ